MSNELIRNTYNALTAMQRGEPIERARELMRSCRQQAEAEGESWEAVKFRAMAAIDRAHARA